MGLLPSITRPERRETRNGCKFQEQGSFFSLYLWGKHPNSHATSCTWCRAALMALPFSLQSEDVRWAQLSLMVLLWQGTPRTWSFWRASHIYGDRAGLPDTRHRWVSSLWWTCSWFLMWNLAHWCRRKRQAHSSFKNAFCDCFCLPPCKSWY